MAERYLRKVIHIAAEDSPNVALGLMQQASGEEPTGEMVLEGVVSWDDYQKRLRLWDEVMVCIGVKGRFWEGSESLLFPPEWLNESARVALQLILREKFRGPNSKWCRVAGKDPFIRRARAGGCDPGEGGGPDRLGTAWCIVDEHGILELLEMRTTDTSVIRKVTKALLRKWNVPPEHFAFDRGGGGKQIADQMRSDGWKVCTVGFGESPTPDPKFGKVRVRERLDQKEDRYAYVSRRAQMYHELRLALDPGTHEQPFAIPAEYSKLRAELAPFPLQYDGEGRVTLPPKHRTGKRQAGQEKTLSERIGHSPDLADALVLAYHMLKQDDTPRPRAGGLKDKTPRIEEADEEYAKAREEQRRQRAEQAQNKSNRW
jgi:hypothetical protein